MDSTQGIFNDIVHLPREDGVTLAVGVAGPTHSTDLSDFLLIHGAGSSMFTFHYQVALLKDHFRVIVPDMRGHGLSNGSSSGDLSVARLLCDLEAIITSLNMHRIVVIGHSLGGSLAARLGQHSSVAAVIAVDIVERFFILFKSLADFAVEIFHGCSLFFNKFS